MARQAFQDDVLNGIDVDLDCFQDVPAKELVLINSDIG
jgi:hypothetical protein